MKKQKEKLSRKIVKRKVFELKPMHEEEAVLQMEMLGHKSFMFYNASTNKYCLLYRRNDGDLGLIEQETM